MPQTFWFLARTKPARERYAERNALRNRACLRVWNPVIEGRKGTEEMLFPTYMFFMSHGQFSFIENTYGCTGVVMRGETADTIPHRTMAKLRVMVKQLQPPPVRMIYKAGQELKANRGPFAGSGVRGTYIKTSERRIWIMLDILSNKVPVSFDPEDVQAVA